MNLASIGTSLQKIPNTFYRYRVLLFVVGYVGCYIFLITQIANYAQEEPSLSTSENAVKTLTIDADSIEKIQELEDQNVEVKALFDDARKNPFSE